MFPCAKCMIRLIHINIVNMISNNQHNLFKVSACFLLELCSFDRFQVATGQRYMAFYRSLAAILAAAGHAAQEGVEGDRANVAWKLRDPLIRASMGGLELDVPISKVLASGKVTVKIRGQAVALDRSKYSFVLHMAPSKMILSVFCSTLHRKRGTVNQHSTIVYI